MSSFALRLGVAHEVGMGLAAFLAVLIVLMGGAFPAPAWFVLLAPALSSFLVLRRIETPRFSGTILGLAGLGLGAAQLVRRGSDEIIFAGGIALLGILAGRLITRRTLGHDVQTLILSLVLVMAGSILNPGLSYGVVFGLFGIAVIWALCTRQLLSGAERSALEQDAELHGADSATAGEFSRAARERSDIVTPTFFGVTASVAVAVLIATSLVFFAFPRVGLGSFSFLGKRQGRFPSSVDLSGSGRAGGGTGVVARAYGITGRPFEDGLYLRGMVYDALTTTGASRLQVPPNLPAPALTLAEGKASDVAYSVMVEPVAENLVFTLGSVDRIRIQKGGEANPNRRASNPYINDRGEYEVHKRLVAPVRYYVRGDISAPGHITPHRRLPQAMRTHIEKRLQDATADERAKIEAEIQGSSIAAPLADPTADWDPTIAETSEFVREQFAGFLALPEDLDPRVVALAQQVAGDAETAEDVAARIRAFLLTTFEYTLDQPNGRKSEPLVSFLLEDRRGHCEYFASAFALMLRINGVPSRVIGGYQGGEYDAAEDVVVFRELNAHAWVEWRRTGAGWIVDDATPMATAERGYLTGFAASLERMQRLWGDLIVDYSLTTQFQLANEARSRTGSLLSGISKPSIRSVGIGGGVLALLLLAVRLWRRRRTSKPRSDPLASAIEATASAALGGAIPLAWTLREAVSKVDAEDPAFGPLGRALTVYERQRFANIAPDGATLGGLLDALRDARRAKREPKD